MGANCPSKQHNESVGHKQQDGCKRTLGAGGRTRSTVPSSGLVGREKRGRKGEKLLS